MAVTKVTVGIPTYNRSALLKQSIASVLAQTYADFVLLVSDNASEDDTAEIVRAFHDERISYVRSERNIGSIANFNRLIELTETEYLVLLPDDDVLYPEHLELAIALLEEHGNAGLAHSAFDLIDMRSQVVRKMNPVATRRPVRIEPSDRVLERLMVSDWPMGFSSIVYRTKAIAAAGGLRADEEPFGDLQLWMRIALDWDFGYLAKPLSGFRLHQQTVTSEIGAREGVTSDGSELYHLYAGIRFQRRESFLASARLRPRSERRLRALATLQLLIDRALAMPGRDVMAGLGKLAWSYPRIAGRPTFWRLAAAQLGGRRARAALRRVARPAHG